MASIDKIFDLRHDAAPMEEIQRRIENDSTVTGTNLVILMLAILIACVGLNTGNFSVVVGAMLISPLMGGVMAIGYGMAAYDWHYIKQSAVKLSFQSGVALLASTCYFLLTPISAASEELLASTSPMVWDVVIAIAGGMAGAIGNTRQEKSNVLPGVAIATALMPPLCTTGYGIANQSADFVAGAVYLFFINGFFIAAASFLVFKLLKVPVSKQADERKQLLQKRILWVLGILITVPSLYAAYQSVNANLADQQVKKFLAERVELTTANVMAYHLDKNSLQLDILGQPLGEEEITKLENQLHEYSHLKGLQLKVVQNVSEKGLDKEQVQKIIETRLGQENRAENGKSYKELANTYFPAYQRSAEDERLVTALNKEAPVLFAKVLGLQGGTIVSPGSEKAVYDTFAVVVEVRESLSQEEFSRLQAWVTKAAGKQAVLVQKMAENS